MKKQLKFVDGIYGFIYDSQKGYIRKIFTEPISEVERDAMDKAIGEDDSLFIVGDEDYIMELWELDQDSDLDGLDINEYEKIVEWK